MPGVGPIAALAIETFAPPELEANGISGEGPT
jgi:hypothetical protein